jgi:DNA (cytosine-5)-methyltransferase 1
MADLHQGGQLEPIDNGERAEGVGSPQPSRDSGFWCDHIWLAGSDGKARRVKPGLSLLAHGVSNRVGRLRAYGNAIVAPLAKEVIMALMEVLDGEQSLQEDR